MKKKIIIIAVILAVLATFGFACYKIVSKVRSFVNMVKNPADIYKTEVQSLPESKPIGTEEYIWGGHHYKVSKYAPDIKNNDKDLILYNEYLNDNIETALAEAKKLEKYIPKEYKKFTPEKAAEAAKAAKKIAEDTIEKLPKEYKDFTKNIQNIGEYYTSTIPDNENKAAGLFYSNLAIIEKENDSKEARQRVDAYKAQVEYYYKKYEKDIVINAVNSDSPLMQVTLMTIKNQYNPELERWKERIIVPGVKEIIKMEPSGYLVPDFIYKRLEKIEIPFDVYDNNITMKTNANSNVPTMKYMEYYATKGNMAEEVGWDLFFFRFDNDFSLFADKYDYATNFVYMLNVVFDTLKKNYDISYINWNSEDPEKFEGPDGERKVLAVYSGKIKSSKYKFSGYICAISKENKVWIDLTKRGFSEIIEDGDDKEALKEIPKEQLALIEWINANDTNLKIEIDGMCKFDLTNY